MLKAGKNNASGGWAEYVWTNPTTKKLEPKKTWVVKHDSLYFAVGFYE